MPLEVQQRLAAVMTKPVMPQSRARGPGSAAIMAAFAAGWKPALLTSEPETEALLESAN
jgi:hypothetical protein